MWWVGNNSRTHPPLLSRHLTLQNLRNINFLLIFSILGGGGGPRKVNDLLTSPSNQFRRLFYLKPHRKVSGTELELRATNFIFSKNIDQLVFKPWLLAEIWVSKNPGFVSGSPPGGLYFQKWPHENKIFLEMSENIKNRHFLTKCLPFVCLYLVFSSPHPPKKNWAITKT